MELPEFVVTRRGPRSFYVVGKQALAAQLIAKHGFEAAPVHANEFARASRNHGMELCIIYNTGSVVCQGDGWQRLAAGLAANAARDEETIRAMGVGTCWYLYTAVGADSMDDWPFLADYISSHQDEREQLLLMKRYLRAALTDHVERFSDILSGYGNSRKEAHDPSPDETDDWWYIHTQHKAGWWTYIFGVGWYKGDAVFATVQPPHQAMLEGGDITYTTMMVEGTNK